MRKIRQTVIVANSQWLMDYSVDGFSPLDTTADGQIVVYRTLKLDTIKIIDIVSGAGDLSHRPTNEYQLSKNLKEYPHKLYLGLDYNETSEQNTFASQYFAVAILEGEGIWKPVFWQRDISGVWNEVLPHELTESNRIMVIRWFITKKLYKQYSEYQQKMKEK